MGDLSQVVPILHPYRAAPRCTGHAADYAIADPALAHAAPGVTRDRYLALHRGVARREVYDGT